MFDSVLTWLSTDRSRINVSAAKPTRPSSQSSSGSTSSKSSINQSSAMELSSVYRLISSSWGTSTLSSAQSHP